MNQFELYDNAPDMFLSVDAKTGNIIFCNQTTADQLGYSKDEIIGKSIFDFYHPDSLNEARKALQIFKTTGKISDVELQILKKNGNVLDVSLSASAIRDENGDIVQSSSVWRDITKRKKFEEDLIESKLQLESAIRASNIGLWDWDLRTNKVYFSPEWKEQIGYEDWEITNDFSEWEKRVHPDDIQKAIAIVKSYLINPWPNYENEFRFRHKDGSYRWILAKASMIQDEKGNPVRMLGSHLDITERKQVEEELRHSQERFVNAFHTSPAGLTITRISDGKFIEANESFCKMFEFSRDEVIGHNSVELNILTPEERKKLIDEQILSGGLNDFELQAHAKSGKVVNILFSSKPMEIGGEAYHVTSMIDITGRKEVEQALRENERRLSSIYETVGDIIFHLAVEDGEHYRFISINSAFSRVTGLPQSAVVGKRVNEVIPEPSLTMVLEKYRQSIETKSIVRWEETSDYPAGRLTGEVSIAPVFDEKGHCTHLVGAVHDITDLKRAEEERLALMNRLIESEEMMRKKAAQQLHDQVGQNLTALTINLNYIMSRLSEESRLIMESRLNYSISILDETIEQIRNIMVELRPSVLDDYGLNAALKWSINKFSERTDASVKYNGKDLSKRLPINIEYTLFRVAQEALHNILKHARAKNVTVTLQEINDLVKLKVEDDGVGFDMNSVKQSKEESGLGLVTMAERINFIGGKLEISSQPGKGTSVSVELKR